MSAHFKKDRGFTLVELLVVISIIAILAVVGITVFSGVQKSARDTKRRADLKAIAMALEIYKSSNNIYPMTPSGHWFCSDLASEWLVVLPPIYMINVPLDPKNTGGIPWGAGFTYCYYSDAGADFMLVAHMESPTTADLLSKCTRALADGTLYTDGSTNSGANNHGYPNDLFVCDQQ